MRVVISKDAAELGKAAAKQTAKYIEQAVREKGYARIVLSTGASQFETLEELTKWELPWECVEMFHLDEYVGLPQTHAASFRQYLQKRFVDKVHPRKVHFVSGEGDVAEHIKMLTQEIRRAPIDVALIGVGENAHIAFNDPPADFETEEAYIVVNLDSRCRAQQVGEGWFASIEEVPQQAISMTVYQIMNSRAVISAVPHQVKAEAVKKMLEHSVDCQIPATKLKEHPDMHLFLDENSAALLTEEVRETVCG